MFNFELSGEPSRWQQSSHMAGQIGENQMNSFWIRRSIGFMPENSRDNVNENDDVIQTPVIINTTIHTGTTKQ